MMFRPNRYYNDPALGQAFTNIAEIFRPPDPADVRNAVEAGAKRAEASRLAELFDYARSPNFDQSTFDRIGQATGQWTPNTGYYGVDSTAQTSRSNNAADNTRALQTNTADNARAVQTNAADNVRALDVARIANEGELAKLFASPIAVNEGQTVYLPPDTASRTGLSGTLQGNISASQGERVTTADGRVIEGASKPLTDSELKAVILGGMAPDMQQKVVAGDIPVEQIVGATGQPEFAYRSDAVGKQPFVKDSAKPDFKNGMAVINGQQVAVIQGGDGKWVTAQTRQPIPDNTAVYSMPQPTGTNADLGIAKSTQGNVEQQLIDIAVAKDTAVTLRDLIARSAASQGAVGWLRGTAQNVIQTGDELGRYFGGNIDRVVRDIKMGAADANLAGNFDTNIPAIEMLGNLLAFQYAKTTTGDRLSNEMLRAAKAALGLDGLTANQADSMARLNQAVKQIEAQERILTSALRNGPAGLNNPAPPPPTPNGIQSTDGILKVNSPEEARKLPPGTRFQAPSGAVITVIGSEGDIAKLPRGAQYMTPSGKVKVVP